MTLTHLRLTVTPSTWNYEQRRRRRIAPSFEEIVYLFSLHIRRFRFLTRTSPRQLEDREFINGYKNRPQRFKYEIWKANREESLGAFSFKFKWYLASSQYYLSLSYLPLWGSSWFRFFSELDWWPFFSCWHLFITYSKYCYSFIKTSCTVFVPKNHVEGGLSTTLR